MDQHPTHLNLTWVIISIVIIGNVFLFQALFSKVEAYSDKVVSTRTSKYDLEEL